MTTLNPNQSDSAQVLTDILSSSSQQAIESHPFAAVLPAKATVMMMGTFPPTRDKWAMQFHYPNFNNDMWRIYGQVFFEDAEHFKLANEKRFDADAIKAFLHNQGIASCPTVRQAVREKGNAADKFLSVVTPVDLEAVLAQVPKVHTIFTTGGKATEVLLELLDPDVRPNLPKTNTSIAYPVKNKTLTLYRLPSTSRAYPLAFSKKVAAYRDFFEHVGVL